MTTPDHRSPLRGMCAAVLTLEAVTLGLTTPVLVTVADQPLPVALTIGVGLLLLCLVAAGALRHRWAYVLGSAIQAGAIAVGVLVPAMVFLGVIFGALWTAALLLGRKIERERTAAYDQAG